MSQAWLVRPLDHMIEPISSCPQSPVEVGSRWDELPTFLSANSLPTPLSKDPPPVTSLAKLNCDQKDSCQLQKIISSLRK